jgi:hypothetical protein
MFVATKRGVMLLWAASCPDCAVGEIAVDCDRASLVFNPDRHAPEACPHLACLFGGLYATEGPGPSGDRLDVRG